MVSMNAEAIQFEIERLQECCTQYRKEIERLTDQVIVDTGIIKSHFERIGELESALKKIRYSCFTPTPEREIARKVLAPDHDGLKTTEQVDNDD